MNGSEFLSGIQALAASSLAWGAWAGILAARWRSLPGPAMLALAAAGAFSAWWAPAVDGLRLPSIVLAIAGGIAALAVPLPRPAAAALVLASGFAAGMAAGFQWATPVEVAGGISAWLLVLSAGHAAVTTMDRHPALREPGALLKRVVGAWVLVLGVLLLLLSLSKAA